MVSLARRVDSPQSWSTAVSIARHVPWTPSRQLPLLGGTSQPPMRDAHSSRALAKLGQIAALENDWDGYGSPAPSRGALEAAARFLGSAWGFGPDPSVGPGYSGTIELEWERATGRTVYVSFLPDGRIRLHGFEDEATLAELETQDVDLIAATAIALLRDTGTSASR